MYPSCRNVARLSRRASARRRLSTAATTTTTTTIPLSRTAAAAAGAASPSEVSDCRDASYQRRSYGSRNVQHLLKWQQQQQQQHRYLFSSCCRRPRRFFSASAPPPRSNSANYEDYSATSPMARKTTATTAASAEMQKKVMDRVKQLHASVMPLNEKVRTVRCTRFLLRRPQCLTFDGTNVLFPPFSLASLVSSFYSSAVRWRRNRIEVRRCRSCCWWGTTRPASRRS